MTLIAATSLACPFCGSRSTHDMPTDACQFFLECPVCLQVIRPKPGDCCVFCSFGDDKCPPRQCSSCDDGAPVDLVVETERLVVRRLSEGDAEFMLGLLNEPSFLRFIGDKGVRTLEDAREYLRKGPMRSYARFGFGLYLTTLKDGDVPIGICGLVKREALDDVDVGFAFRPDFWSQGYAFEAATAVLAHARGSLGLSRLVAIVSPDNDRSIQLLERLGLRFERMIQLAADGPEIKLFASAG
jgi:RimJ/RimL family protein N-acetyltransferase